MTSNIRETLDENDCHDEVKDTAISPPRDVPRFEWDIRNLEYVLEVDDNLVCAICRCPFVSPIRLRCEHVFCEDCLSETFNHQQEATKTCPSCRRPADEFVRPAHRIIQHILDDLQVKCPLHLLGCPETVSRGAVQTHIDHYCGYETTACPLESCTRNVPRRLADGSCLHQWTSCPDCGDSIMQLAMARHQQKFCSAIVVDCPYCSDRMQKAELTPHISNKCPAAIIACLASPYGCAHTGPCSAMESHTSTCPLVKLAPFLAQQDARMQEHALALKQLQRKAQLHDDFLDTVRDTLSELPPPPPLPPPHGDPADAAAPVGPFTSPASHLLHLHESLREELGRVARAVSDLDAKTDLGFLNGSLRQKEEMAHRDAALAQVRAQVQWLVSGRLVRGEAWRGRVGAAAMGMGVGMGASRGQGAGTGGGGGGGGGGSAVTPPARAGEIGGGQGGQGGDEWEVGGGVEGTMGRPGLVGGGGGDPLAGRVSRRPSDGASANGREKL